MTQGPRTIWLGLCAALLFTGCSALFASNVAYPASWRLAHPLTPDATTVDLVIHESKCAGGSSPEGRILDPKVDYTPTSITVTVEVRLASTLASGCQSNPEYPLTVNLREPVGTRPIVGPSGQHGFEPGPTPPPRHPAQT